MSAGDVVVVAGGGAAGLAAAIGAARRGTRVVLLEAHATIGGVVSRGLIHTIGGLFDASGDYLNGGLSQELAERLLQASAHSRRRKIGRLWTLVSDPQVYHDVVQRWLNEEPLIEVHCRIRGLLVDATRGRVGTIQYVHQDELKTLHPVALLDCTGNANVIRQVGPHLVQDDPGEALAGLVFRIRGVAAAALTFPQGVNIHREIRAAVASGELPTACANVWLDTGVFDDEVYAKFSVHVPAASGAVVNEPPVDTTLPTLGAKLLAFLGRFPAFAHAVVVQMGEVSRRGGTRIVGDYRITASDVRDLRTFPDAACRCAWPIEYWDPDEGVKLEYLRDPGHFEIPMQALKVAGAENLWAAGKCLSADVLAQASARIAGCCWAMGEAAAAGMLAASARVG